MNTHRHALRQQHPAKGGFDVGQPQPARFVVAVPDPTPDALHVPRDDRIVSHQHYLRGIPDANMAQFSLLKIPHHPEAVGIDDGDLCLPAVA